MNRQITIREAITEQDVSIFWEQLRAYQKRDIFPDPENEDREYFLSAEYQANIEELHERSRDRLYYLFFCCGGQDIGFAMPAIYETEEGKCFLLEFCVFPEFRGEGTGQQCARKFLDWAKAHGASYVELNCATERRQRFWKCFGFLPNGLDEWGEPLMILPPPETVPITVERLKDASDWQLQKLENSFLAEIGEEILTDEKKERLREAIEKERILFFLARCGHRAVGMCSVAVSFSTFTCESVGTFDDFFVEPVFRGQGVARKLAKAAQEWSVQNDIASLTVCCSQGDEAMYQALGFEVPLGKTFSYTSN